MKTLRCIISEGKRIVCYPPFFVCCVLVVVLEFTAGLCLVNGQDEISVMEAVLTISREQMEQNTNYCSFEAFQAGTGSWFKLFVPILAALPFVALYRDEVSTGYRRFRIASMGKFRYCITKFITCFLGGALTVSVGTALYGVCVAILFPSLNAYNPEDIQMFLEMLDGTIPELIGQQMLSTFLYGGFWSIVSFALLGFVQNKYLIVGIPFMLKYIWGELCLKIEEQGVGPDSLILLFYEKETMGMTLVVYGVLSILCCLLFWMVTVRKEDLGV